MPDIPGEAHVQILEVLHDALAEVRALRDATEYKHGYMGFVLVDRELTERYADIANERDQAAVINILRALLDRVTVVSGGAVAPAAQRARRALVGILRTLEEPDETGAASD
jgi:hypothetical protein